MNRVTPRVTSLLLACVVGALLSCSVAAVGQDQEDTKQQVQNREAAMPSPEALARKERSTRQLQAEGVPMIAHLPVIEDSKEAIARSKEEIVHRTVAIALAAVKAEGVEQALMDSLVKHYNAAGFFSPEEAVFIKNPHPDERDKVKFSWRYEDLWVLLWSLGYVDHLERPEAICDVSKAVGFIKNRDTAQLIADAKLRPLSEILDQSDLIYRYHWAVVNARLKGQPTPANLEAGVVMERAYALNWLIGYMGQAWDHISTDT